MLAYVVCALLASSASAIWPFTQKRFKNSLIDSGSMGIDGNGRIIAFGDFNSDQFLDVVSLSEDQRTLALYYWSHADLSFQQLATFRHPNNVLNVVPGDFRHIGKLDILVMSQSPGSSDTDMTLYLSPSFSASDSIKIPSSTQSQPVVIDVDGDLKIDLLGESSSKGRGSYQLWQNVWNSSDPHSSLFKMMDPNFHGSQCTLANPHSNAVVDLDGDCLADLFLVCDDGGGRRSYQIWVNKKEDGFFLSQRGTLPSGVQSISFADIGSASSTNDPTDRDGTIDMIFPTCSHVSSDGIGEDCYINIAFNQQLSLCSSTTESDTKRACRSPQGLCIADPNFSFEFNDSSKKGSFIRFPIKSLFSKPRSLLVYDTSSQPPVPLPLKLGDANLDGFPDILMITVSGRERIPALLFSTPCSPGVAGCSSADSEKHGWTVAKNNARVLSDIKDARSVSFLDVDEDGSLDILVQRSGATGQGKISFIQNNIYYDAFFLKAIVLNGACNSGWCDGDNGTKPHQPFGVSYSGASYKYTVLDTSGHRSAAQVGQIPQTSYQSLQTPYSYFGLGRTNNYIENLFVGTTIHSKQHYINLEGVVPNSRVVINPSLNEDEAWRRELFLRPGEWTSLVTITVVIAMLILAIIVFILHMNEKREDELERKRVSHHINFDAL
ncbi:hypothetical protein F5887DRAFT_874393 [Amanita rubescens]|nr:hypothetical protein F5887DRAFT_874393 [Amanita rubescens]